MSRLNRRRFLQSAALLGLADTRLMSPLSAFAAADSEASASAITFGFSLYGMRSLKLADALNACADIGYDGVELVANADWPCDPGTLSRDARREIRKQLQDLGLGLPSLMENLHVVVDDNQHKKNLDRLKAACELAHDLAPDQPPVIETILGGSPSQWDKIKGQMADGLKEWAHVAEQDKTVLAVKAHVGGALHTPQDAKWLVDEVDNRWVRLTYDFSHFQLRNYRLDESLKTMIDDAVFIHVKDTSGTADKFQFLLPGDGKIDYVAYFNQLKAHKYHGPVVVEVSGQIHSKPGYDPLQAAQHSYDNLAPAFRQAGLRQAAKPGRSAKP